MFCKDVFMMLGTRAVRIEKITLLGLWNERFDFEALPFILMCFHFWQKICSFCVCSES